MRILLVLHLVVRLKNEEPWWFWYICPFNHERAQICGNEIALASASVFDFTVSAPRKENHLAPSVVILQESPRERAASISQEGSRQRAASSPGNVSVAATLTREYVWRCIFVPVIRSIVAPPNLVPTIVQARSKYVSYTFSERPSVLVNFSFFRVGSNASIVWKSQQRS